MIYSPERFRPPWRRETLLELLEELLDRAFAACRRWLAGEDVGSGEAAAQLRQLLAGVKW